MFIIMSLTAICNCEDLNTDTDSVIKLVSMTRFKPA